MVKNVLSDAFRFELVTEEAATWDLFWADTGVNSKLLSAMRPYQRVNHYPVMYCVSRKNHLGRNLMRMRKVLPKEYNFFPQTWLLPVEWAEFRPEFVKGRTFIFKPEALSQGKGIFLSRTFEGISTTEHYVAQRYITRPYLIEGLKFDLRIYVLVYGCDPLRLFIYREGLARLATEAYRPPEDGNLEEMYVHLTNYAINKNNSKFEFNVDAEKTDVGHKRSLEFVWKYIADHGGDAAKLQTDIKRCIIKTMCAVQPLLAHSYRSAQPLDTGNSRCFEVLGFDILLDHKLKPWLLEVNHSPSFTTDTPFDLKLKTKLITDTVRLLHFNPKRREKCLRKLERRHQDHVLGTKTRMTKEEREARVRHKMEKRDRYEMANLGEYTRMYPDGVNDDYYNKIIETAGAIWEEFTGAKRKKDLMQNKKPEYKGDNFRPLAGQKKNIVPKNRKPLYYLKAPSPLRPLPAPEECLELAAAGEEDPLVEGEVSEPEIVPTASMKEMDDFVDAIARKYGIPVVSPVDEYHLPAIPLQRLTVVPTQSPTKLRPKYLSKERKIVRRQNEGIISIIVSETVANSITAGLDPHLLIKSTKTTSKGALGRIDAAELYWRHRNINSFALL